MLDKVGGRIDDPGDEQHVRRHRMAANVRGFVLMPRIGEFDTEGADLRAVEQWKQRGERNIVSMRSFPVAPAHVQSKLLARYVRPGAIDGLDVYIHGIEEVRVPLILE